MRLYEGLFIFAPEATADTRKNQLKNLDDLVAKFKGKVVQKTELGKKTLGYTVKKFREGYVVVVDYQMESLKQGEFRKTLQLQDDIVKFMIITKVEEKKVVKKAEEPAKTTVKASTPPSGSHPVSTR